MIDLQSARIAVIGLGYVGLPLAVEFSKQYPTTGFDINTLRISQLQQGEDATQEVSTQELNAASNLSFTDNLDEIRDCNIYIVTVPTPIDRHKQPDLKPLQGASRAVAQVIAKGDIVIYESTVYPGVTEDVCIPIIEELTGLTFNQDFYAGYSPERINPGDKQHRVSTITKVTSGSTPEAADLIDALYASIITAGTHKAASIKVAEAAKVIENTQRDLNIALINELSIIFNTLDIDTLDVLEAAGTKWNFLPFRPGLVGGHCIGVDPYYLTHKAQEVGYNPEVILAGRRINDSMGAYVVERVIKMLITQRVQVADARILIMGLTFKENCPDIRNTRVVDVISEFEGYQTQVDVYDPWVDPEEALQEYDVKLISQPETNTYDAIVLCVGHQEFIAMGADKIREMGTDQVVLFDVKNTLDKNAVDGRL